MYLIYFSVECGFHGSLHRCCVYHLSGPGRKNAMQVKLDDLRVWPPSALVYDYFRRLFFLATQRGGTQVNICADRFSRAFLQNRSTGMTRLPAFLGSFTGCLSAIEIGALIDRDWFFSYTGRCLMWHGFRGKEKTVKQDWNLWLGN